VENEGEYGCVSGVFHRGTYISEGQLHCSIVHAAQPENAWHNISKFE
jgi:hypothetical protein